MKLIPLSQNLSTLVDDEDYDFLMQWGWYANHGRAVRMEHDGYNTKRQVLMHRVIARAPSDMAVDHINRDPLDNRRANLRVVTDSQNQFNRGPRKDNTTGIVGVSYSPRKRRWVVRIKAHRRVHHIGEFKWLADAIGAHSEAVWRLHGEYGHINTLLIRRALFEPRFSQEVENQKV